MGGFFFKQLILPQHFGIRYAILMSFLYSICIVSYRDLDGLKGLFFFWFTHEMRFKLLYANALEALKFWQ